MFTNANLSFEAAPPIKVVFRFFLTAAIFAVVAGVAVFFNFNELENIYSPITLSIVHLFTLGVMSHFVFGALFQMLPVIAGVSINNSEKVSLRVHYALLFGTIFLISAFLNSNGTLYFFASLFLSFAFFYTSYIFVKELKKISHSNSSKGMFFASISIALVVFFALILIALKNGVPLPFDFLAIKAVHFSFGLFGLFTMLILAVSFQVIEMFYVTPPYPKIYAKYATVAIFILLILGIFKATINVIAINLIAIILISHSILTIKLIKNKKRAVTDATIWFWYFAMINLLLFSLLVILNSFLNIPIVLIGTIFSFFIFSVVFAMVFKIVPFLVWFQLNRQGYFDGPMMHEVIHPKVAKRVFYLFLSSYIFFILANIYNPFSYLASILFILLFTILVILIYNAWQKYLFTLKNGIKLNFPSNI